jgi:N-acetylneuraminic acid mutarotase
MLPPRLAGFAVLLLGVASSACIDTNSPARRSAAPSTTPARPSVSSSAGPGWELLPAAPIESRRSHVGIWIGTEMLVWGGGNEGSEPDLLADGGRYSPSARRWRSIPKAPIPGRARPSTVWTGNELVVWGGGAYEGTFGDGAAYNRTRDSWRTLADSPLSNRVATATVWTGQEMIIWGGLSGERPPEEDGAAYDPAADRWRMLPRSPLSRRAYPSAVWTGRQMLIWGGLDFPRVGTGRYLADGASYDPKTNKWTVLSSAPLRRRAAALAVWTGEEMLIWGGWDSGEYHSLKDGAAYRPATGSWRRLPHFPLASRSDAAAAWTGTEWIIWGGDVPNSHSGFADGAALSPNDSSWRILPAAPLLPRRAHSVVWTGADILVWGGGKPGQDRAFVDGAIYRPPADCRRVRLPQGQELNTGLDHEHQLITFSYLDARAKRNRNVVVYYPYRSCRLNRPLWRRILHVLESGM